jgi:hypothetical protein
MVRFLVVGALYGEYLPSGEWAALIPTKRFETHAGPVNFPPGESYGLMFPRCTNVNGFRFGGQAHDTINPAAWQYDRGQWQSYPQPCVGVNAVIYDRRGTFVRSDGSVGSQGFRYVRPDNVIVSGDATYRPFNGLCEYTTLPSGLSIGQAAYDGGGIQVWDGVVLRQLELGDCRFVRANESGDTVALAFTRPDGVVRILTTVAELRALPPVVVPPKPPKPPDPPKPPPPVPPLPPVPPQPPLPPVPPVPPQRSFRHHKESRIMADTLVVLRGPGGKLGRPDNPNTGPWAGEGAGWRGVVFDGTDKTDERYHHIRPAAAPDALVHKQHGSVMGCDATLHSGGLDKQHYYKPDGQTAQGWAERWQFYDGNANGAIEAQVEYAPGSGGDDGAFFAYPLAVEVIG